jgi:hypothetical protein
MPIIALQKKKTRAQILSNLNLIIPENNFQCPINSNKKTYVIHDNNH